MERPIIPIERRLKEATMVARPNRFRAEVEVMGRRTSAHVHDPGRLRELLYPGNRLLVSEPKILKARKTGLDILFAWDGEHWVLVNSVLHRPISEKILMDQWLLPRGPFVEITPEVAYGPGTRFDYLLRGSDGGRCYVEVKGCTLADANRVALFPDAPTKRGARHLEELIDARRRGLGAILLILVFRPNATTFSPNEPCDPRFARLFWRCIETGVGVYVKRIAFKKGWFVYTGDIPVKGGVA